MMAPSDDEIAELINNAVEGLGEGMTKNLASLVQVLIGRYNEGDDRLEHPTLIVWADSAEIDGFGSHVGAFVRFGDNIEKLHGDELRFGFDGALTYLGLASAVASLAPLLSSTDTVVGLVHAARPRLMLKHFGVAA